MKTKETPAVYWAQSPILKAWRKSSNLSQQSPNQEEDPKWNIINIMCNLVYLIFD